MKFGQEFANRIRLRLPQANDKWDRTMTKGSEGPSDPGG
jgi:hypothetical protein